MFLFRFSRLQVTKVPVEECELYTTFEDCVGGGSRGQDVVGDPYCGWCTLYQRCTRGVEFECPGVENPSLPHRWLTMDDENTRIEKISPPNTDSGTTMMLHITVLNLPALDNQEAYQCIFGELGDRPAAVNTTIPSRTVVTCYTPPNIPEPVDGFTQVELTLRHTKTNVDVVSTDFFFYKCSTFSTCSECVAQDFGCNWCGYENMCTVNLGQCEPAGIIYGVGSATSSPDNLVGQEYCPRVDLGNDTEILIPAGILQDVQLNVANLLTPLGAQTSGYQCVFEYEGKEVSVQADLDGDDRLVCQQREYDYNAASNTVTGSMTVTWNNEYVITDKEIPVILYKCAVDRANCGLCLSADPKFQCGWCSSEFECGIASQCQDNDWLIGEDAVCPDPTIREISPISGYFAGGTNLTIKGYNLGLTAADITRITVAGIECIKDEASYITALQISCTTQSSSRPHSGYVEMTIGNTGGQMYVATSQSLFRYVLPKITGVSPTYGPASGGSLVSILGHNLDAGSSSVANLVGVSCQIVSASPSEVLCLSGPAEVGTEGYVSMTVDDHYVEGSSVFQYRSDPVITRVSRFSSINSGSLELDVEGRDFDVIQWPQLSFLLEDEQFISNCSISAATSMMCLTPSLSDLNLTLPLEVPIANVSFLLDGVMEYTPLQNNGQISGLDEYFIFVSDPVFYPFENQKLELEYDQRKFIKISGDNLTLAYREGDVRVTIGGAPCTDVVVKLQELTCYAPESPPSEMEGKNLFDVRVYHGALSFLVGQVEYLPQAIPLALIVGSVAGGVLFLLVVLIMGVCIASYRKNNNNEKIFKQMEEQIGTLELTVAQECKEAFAELQTGVLSITHDIKGHGIPILDYRTYVVKSLFPENPNHAVLKELSVAGVRKDFVQKGLWQFGQLLSNKSFLLIFIRVLEEQRTLSTKDLSNVASLLVVAFQGKMEYCTDVLKALMARAIKQHVKEGEESARVFMRRGVSVVEKMVGHWLAVLLYNHLQDHAGEPLFKLFYAIKQQVEKGPVDSVTGEARYSLTEGKLIRQQVEVKQLTLKAQGPDRNTPMVEVKVLDCDTISQTKAKILDAIYKTSPYSQRPKKEELDLEWYDRPGGKLLLFDDDALRPMEGGWRKLNTLSHYQVMEGATVYLLQAQGSSGSLHSNHSSPARSYSNVNVSFNAQTPASSMSPMITLDYENANRMWHLVKPQDHQQLENGVTDRKMMAEIYLPRLLTTKTILHKFVDDLVTTVFILNDGNSLPLAIKYLFDFLDEQAHENGITDPAIIHAWKSNSLPLRFWVNLIKNPDMIFDIHKADTVDSCLSVVAQCVMEACSVSEQQLNKNSPASKLLYAKDIPTYKEYVSQYYRDIQSMPVISDQDMNAMLAEHSQRHHYDFHMLSALNELYFGYACKYRSELITALDEDSTAIKQGHAEKIEDIERIMSKSF
ncbi:plexin-A2-like [Lytechinus variegatus]|uniref:plexin-A2-like n=1 Tax=Lytechinus variegatus TaxID=7654 RepID=UPI001BB201CC|nr:plexin-A2-like [Lytechinus variegatus]